MGQGPRHRAVALRSRGLARRPNSPDRARRVCLAVRALREREEAPRPRRLRRPVVAGRHRAHRRRPICGGYPVAVPAPLRRRVPRRQPGAVPALAGLAGRPGRSVRRGRPEPGDLQLERRRPHAPYRVSGAVSIGRGRHSGRQLPLDAADPRRRQRGFGRRAGRAPQCRTRGPRGERRTSRGFVLWIRH